jgi:hypothetical protein
LADEQPESNIVNNVVAVVMVLINPALVGMPGILCSFDLSYLIDAYRCRRELSLSHACAVLLHGDFAFYESGNAISNLVMVSMVVVRLLIMLGEEAMISFFG